MKNNNKISVWEIFKLTNLDTIIPTITINPNLPSSVTRGDGYVVLGSYTANGPSGGSTSCSSNLDGIIIDTSQLTSIGNHTITCTVITGAGKVSTISKQIKITYDSYTANNLIINGSFENSTNGWFGFLDASLSNKFSLDGNYSLLLDIPTSNGTNGMSVQVISQKPVLHHKYYGKIYYYSEYSLSVHSRFEWFCRDDFYYAQGKGLLLFTSESINPVNSWRYKSDIVEIIDDTYLNENWMIRNFSYNNDYPIYADNLIMIDLTDTFGAGNEPDKEWCDRHISYFDGSSIIYK